MKLNNKIIKSEKGFTLIEILIAMVILSLVGVVLLLSLQTVTRVRVQVATRTTAEGLATSQMETIKAAVFIKSEGGIAVYPLGQPEIDAMPSGFRYKTANSDNSVAPVENIIYGIPWNITTDNSSVTDTDIQKITVIVESNNELTNPAGWKQIYKLIGFKVQ
jgi:prepilin-type N-terminal cleavage/methylation domain-containing protein